MKWCRLYTEILDDPKMVVLTDRQFRIFIYLLAAAAEADRGGVILMPSATLAWRLRLPHDDLQDTLRVLKSLAVVDFDDRSITIVNWKKRQFQSDNSYERVKRFRAVSRNVSETVTETATETPPDTDTDTEKTLCDRTEGFEEFYQLYPLKRNPTRALKSWAKAVKKGNGTASAIMDALSKQIAHKAHLKSTGAFCPEWPHPSTWLNDERWKDEIPEQSKQRTDNSNTVHSVTCPACKRTVLSSDMQGSVCILCAEVTDA